uniref:hypothetical protein n=1 Tax=Ningiella ruwaisensis TaxID=2364274 RepID=UPI0010A0154F|nr:hypothetical protein [Ningiella ruwaisensis]
MNKCLNNPGLCSMLMCTLFISALSACSQKDPEVDIGLSKGEGESRLAEAVFCTASSEVLRSYESNLYQDMDTWHETFNDIYLNAKQEASALEDKDGALIDTRLNTIKSQTSETLNAFEESQNQQKFAEFIEQTMQQCAHFAS